MAQGTPKFQVHNFGARQTPSVQNVLRILEHSEDVFAPCVSLVDPLSVLLARGRWAKLALDRAALADALHPEWFGHWPPRGAQLGLRVVIGDRFPVKLNSYDFVERFLVEQARAGVVDAATQ